MPAETILVIDTDAETTQSIVSILESHEYLVFTAPNKDVGITMAKKVTPSLIFLNPSVEGTGLELCKTIHHTEELKNIPIVVFSAFEGASDPKYISLYGIVGSLKKPFTQDELLKKTKSSILFRFSDLSVAAEESESHDDYMEPTQHADADKTVVKSIKDFDLSDKTIVKSAQKLDISDQTVVMQTKKLDISENTEIKKLNSFPEKSKTDYRKILSESPDEVTGNYERTYVLKSNIRRRNMGSRLTLPLIILLIVVLGGGGFFLYKNDMLPISKIQEFIGSKTGKPVKQPAVQAQKPVQPQLPAQDKPGAVQTQPPITPATPAAPAVPSVTAPGTSASQTVPATPVTVKPEPAKPTAKAAYHVQVGAFKNMDNAKSMTKKYKEKGYDAFTQKTTSKGSTLYRVLIGSYEDKKEALKTAKNISAKEKTSAIVYHD